MKSKKILIIAFLIVSIATLGSSLLIDKKQHFLIIFPNANILNTSGFEITANFLI